MLNDFSSQKSDQKKWNKSGNNDDFKNDLFRLFAIILYQTTAELCIRAT